MDDTRDVTEDGQEDVDEEVGIAASFEEDSYRRQEDREYDLADIRGCERHGDVDETDR